MYVSLMIDGKRGFLQVRMYHTECTISRSTTETLTSDLVEEHPSLTARERLDSVQPDEQDTTTLKSY